MNDYSVGGRSPGGESLTQVIWLQPRGIWLLQLMLIQMTTFLISEQHLLPNKVKFNIYDWHMFCSEHPELDITTWYRRGCNCGRSTFIIVFEVKWWCIVIEKMSTRFGISHSMRIYWLKDGHITELWTFYNFAELTSNWPSYVGPQWLCNRSFWWRFCVATLRFGFVCWCSGFCLFLFQSLVET